MTDLGLTIAPKTDQLNADHLLAGPLTIRITRVSLASEADQPISIHYDGDDGKPYRPCKSMRRVLVQVWGRDGNAYTGRSMTLYRDHGVQFGGVAVGGIRISHMTGIDKPVTMALTATRANRKPFTVKPLVEEKAAQPRRTARDLLAAIKARADAGDTLEAIETSEDVKLIRSKGSDAAKAELGALLSSLAAPEAAYDGELAESAP